MEVEFLCSDCKDANREEIADSNSMVRCSSCGKTYGTAGSFLDAEKGLARCVICGCRDLYVQKDFNRKIGCTIAAIGAVLAPFTKFISLLVCALIDFLLYRFLPFIAVCYRCKSIYRDFPPNPDHQPFNLGINDRYESAARAAK